MSYVIGVLLDVHRQQQEAFVRLVAGAPCLGLPNVRLDEVSRLLLASPDHELRGLLLGATNRSLAKVKPAGESPAVQHAAILLESEVGAEALAAYPLDSRQLLSAATSHGVDQRILRAVHQQLGK